MRRPFWLLAAVLTTSLSAAAQTAAPTPAAPAGAAPAPSPAQPASPQTAPPGYYVEPPSGPPATGDGTAPPPPAGQTVYEPPPPGFYPPGAPVYEPPPPPEPHHIAPKTSLWVGARGGWFIPFGNAYAHTVPDQYGNALLKGVAWSHYASAGPMLELDLGMRVSRSYNVFVLWEHASLGAGSEQQEPPPDNGLSKPTGGDTDFYALGLRANTDPDRVGFVTELALGYRRARNKWADGAQLQLTDAPFEARIGLGAEFRINHFLTLSPLLTVGVGSFQSIRFVKNGSSLNPLSPTDTTDGHAWATFTLGGHFDAISSK